jgi:hypothetical protein
VYLIFALINCLAFPPITGAKDTNYTATIRKTNGENTAFNLAETEETFFALAMSKVFGYHAVGVGKCILSQGK